MHWLSPLGILRHLQCCAGGMARRACLLRRRGLAARHVAHTSTHTHTDTEHTDTALPGRPTLHRQPVNKTNPSHKPLFKPGVFSFNTSLHKTGINAKAVPGPGAHRVLVVFQRIPLLVRTRQIYHPTFSTMTTDNIYDIFIV